MQGSSNAHLHSDSVGEDRILKSPLGSYLDCLIIDLDKLTTILDQDV